MPESYDYDAIVLGAGPAGINCALELHDRHLNYAVFERNCYTGGQLNEINNSIKTVAAGYFPNGRAMQRQMEELVTRLKLNVNFNEEITAVNLSDKTVKSGNKIWRAKVLVLATGAFRRQLSISYDNKFDKDVSFDIERTLEEYSGLKVGVVGGGDSALLDALDLAEVASSVSVIHRGATFRARKDILLDVEQVEKIELLSGYEVEALTGATSLESVTLKSNFKKSAIKLPIDRLVVKIGYAANSQLFQGQAKMDDWGRLVVDDNCQTSITGVFAIGDVCSKGLFQIATAMGQGITAASFIRRLLEG